MIRKLITSFTGSCHLLLVHTEYEARYFKQHGLSNRAIVVGNGIEDRNDGLGSRFRDQHGVTGRMILFVGRKDADKGYRLVVQAFAGVRNDSRCRFGLHGIGVGNALATPGVLELGFADEKTKHDALAACDLLCVPSEAESFGLLYAGRSLPQGAFGQANTGIGRIVRQGPRR